MIEVSVCKEHSIKGIGADWKRVPVPSLVIPLLKKAAVYQKPGIIGLQIKAGAGDILRRSEKTQLDSHEFRLF
jgi:hypothetical protein